MTPAEYMASLLKGTATVPGASMALGMGDAAPPMGKGGQPPPAGVTGGATPPPTPGQTPAAQSFGDTDTAALANFLKGGGSLQDQLAFAQKYDPNAKIEDYQIEQGGGESGSSTRTDQKLVYDQSKLPQYANIHQDWMGDHPDTIVPLLGGGLMKSGVASLADPSHAWIDPTTGLPVTYSRNININEAANRAEQSAGQNMFFKIGDAIVPKSPLAVLLMAAGGAATAAGVPMWASALGKTGINMAAQKIGS